MFLYKGMNITKYLSHTSINMMLKTNNIFFVKKKNHPQTGHHQTKINNNK